MLVLAFWLSCAKEGSPPGGPADETPPRIESVSPRADSTRVAADTRLYFTFSEKIDRKGFESTIFISPNPSLSGDEERPLKFKWRGKKVEIVFPDSLKPNRTYVVTIGTDVRDLHSNRMKESFSSAFSTGDSLDEGRIAGRIIDTKPAGTLILAYIMSEERYPNPAKDYADYYTQASQDGQFNLPYLAPGRYRVFALADRDADRLYTRGDELIGVPAQDVILTSASLIGRELSFHLAAEDTLRPTLGSVTVASINQTHWRFDEAVSPSDSLWERRLHLVPTSGENVRIILAARHPLDLNQIQVITENLQTSQYRAFADSLYDATGNPLDSLLSTTEISGTTQSDTSRPRIVKISIADSSKNIALDAPFDLYFTEIMRQDSSATPRSALEWPIVVQDTSGQAVLGKASWVNPFQFRFAPEPKWQSRMRYTVRIEAGRTRDWNGNALFDTTGSVTFWTLNADTLASISGSVSDIDSAAYGPVELTARQVANKVEYDLTLSAPGEYLFKDILPGLYLISAYRDANSNGAFDSGNAFPFRPSERYAVLPDTVKVRSRWPNEGNDFGFQ